MSRSCVGGEVLCFVLSHSCTTPEAITNTDVEI